MKTDFPEYLKKAIINIQNKSGNKGKAQKRVQPSSFGRIGTKLNVKA